MLADVLASAKSPYSDTMAAIPGKTARSVKNATLPEVDRIRFSEIDQNTRQRISLHPRGGICSGVFASRPRPGSRARARSTSDRKTLRSNISAPVLSFVGYLRRRIALMFQHNSYLREYLMRSVTNS